MVREPNAEIKDKFSFVIGLGIIILGVLFLVAVVLWSLFVTENYAFLQDEFWKIFGGFFILFSIAMRFILGSIGPLEKNNP